MVQGKIAHRRKIVQVRILIPGFGQLLLGLAEFFILHLQLDLVHPQLMNQAPALLRRQRLRSSFNL